MSNALKKPLLSVILPTYNERQNIVPLIQTVISTCKKLHVPYEIIHVDDNSPDGTAKTVQQKFKGKSNVKQLVRTKNPGLATAIEQGISLAKGSFILVMDTDFNHDPAVIPQLFKSVQSHDLVIGSRYIRGGGMENKTRALLSKIFNIFVSSLLHHSVSDSLSGFFIIRKKSLQSLDPQRIFYGFGDYFIRLVYFARQKELIIAEVPVFYKNRRFGRSKSQFVKMFLTYTYSVLRLRLT